MSDTQNLNLDVDQILRLEALRLTNPDYPATDRVEAAKKMADFLIGDKK